MKKTTVILSICLLAISAFALPLFAGDGCCAGNTCGVETTPTGPAAEQAQQYTCPMHPEVVSGKPGKCPKCGMNLVPVKEPAKSKM